MNRCIRILVPAAMLAVMSVGVIAQGPPGLTPQQTAVMNAKRKKWDTWRTNHKQISALRSTMMGFGELDKDPKTKLTKPQAKAILAVVKAWRSKPVMTDDQAKQVNKSLTKSLTPAQLQKMATAPRGFGGRGFGGGARPGGGGAPGGGGNGGGRPGGGGQRAGFDPTKFPDPRDYNPLNPDSDPMAKMSPEMNQRVKDRFNGFVGKLEAAAK